MMTVDELIEKLKNLDCGTLEIVVRGEDVVGGVADVYLDFDHTDDDPFVALDVDTDDTDENQPSLEPTVKSTAVHRNVRKPA